MANLHHSLPPWTVRTLVHFGVATWRCHDPFTRPSRWTGKGNQLRSHDGDLQDVYHLHCNSFHAVGKLQIYPNMKVRVQKSLFLLGFLRYILRAASPAQRWEMTGMHFVLTPSPFSSACLRSVPLGLTSSSQTNIAVTVVSRINPLSLLCVKLDAFVSLVRFQSRR